MVSHSTNLPTHVAMKYGESIMADKWPKQLPKFCNCSKKFAYAGLHGGQ